MKINIQKLVKCLTVLLAVVAVTLTAIAPTAHALGSRVYKASDFVRNAVVDGNNRKVYYEFGSPVEALTQIFDAGGSMVASGFGEVNHKAGEGVTALTINTYSFGARFYTNSDAWDGLVDIRDIMPGADVTFDFSSRIEYLIEDSDNQITVRYVPLVCVYDENLKPLQAYSFSAETEYLPTSEHEYQHVLDYMGSVTVPAGGAYLAIRCSYNVSSDQGLADATFFIRPDPVVMNVDINMIYEQSQTMDAIKNELGEMNDKLDDIISGGEAGDNLNDVIAPSSPFGDASDRLDDAMDGFEDSSSKLPEPDSIPEPDSPIPTQPGVIDPTDVSGPPLELPDEPETPTEANPDSVEDYVDIAANFFDWEASGLTYMYAPMVLSVTLAIVFYTVFGKA